MLLSEEQTLIRDTARDFARDRVAPHVRAWEAEGAIPRALLAERQPLPWHVPDDALADPRHVVDERGAERGGEHVHRPVGKPPAQELNHGVAADEVADPHVRHQQDGGAIREIGRAHV